MMVNANLMLLVVMLWAGTLPVASPQYHPYMPKTFWEKIDCDKYILPIHAMWIPRTSCGDNKRYSCQAGYISQVQTTCKHGDWFLEPVCQTPAECPPGVKITNSDNVTESRQVGEGFSFNCSVDTKLTNTLTCGENGIWEYQNGAACPGVIIPGTNIKVSSRRLSSSNCDEACANDTSCGFVKPVGTDECQIYSKPTIYFGTTTSLFQCIQKCKDDSRCLTIVYYQSNTCVLFSDQFPDLRLENGHMHTGTVVEKNDF